MKDIGFNPVDENHLTTDTPMISMKTGWCGGRDFEITACEKKGSNYVLTCKREVDSSINKAFPHDPYQISAGDYFVFVGIALDDIYVKAAEQRLLKAAKDYLNNNDKSKYTYLPKVDNVFMARNPRYASMLKEGNILDFKDTDLNVDASVIIQSIVITEGGAIPTYEVTLFNDRIVSTIEKIQESITHIANNTGITMAQAKSLFHALINAWYPNWFDQKLHTFDDVKFKSVIADFFRTSTFAQGVDGFSVDERGRMFARSLSLFDFLETPEFRYNKVTVVGDEQWRTTGGIIEEILDDGNGEDNKSRIKLKLEENEVNEFYEGDICKGIFHTGTGFKSVYFIVVSSMDEPNFQAGIMDVVLTGYMVAPLKAMTIARIGNVLYDEVDGKTVARYPERQRSSRVSTVRGNVQWYDHVDSWEITSKNIVMHYGEVKNAGLPGVPLEASGYSFWCNSVYIQNSVTYVDAEGEVIPEVTAVEPWEEGKTYTRNNQVSYLGCVYLCIAKSTTSVPRYDNPDWFMTAGNPNFVMELESSNGSRFVNDNIDTDIIASVFKYNQDITIDISKAQWTWTRESDYPDSDTIWNAQHVGFGNTLHLARTDFPESGVRKVTFACTAFLDEINSVTEKIKIR